MPRGVAEFLPGFADREAPTNSATLSVCAALPGSYVSPEHIDVTKTPVTQTLVADHADLDLRLI